jgi:putative hemolysin
MNIMEKVRRAIIWLRRQLVISHNRLEIVYADDRITSIDGDVLKTTRNSTQAEHRRRQSYQLRYRVYCVEQGGIATAEERLKRRQKDKYDAYADYLMAVRTYRVWPFGRPLLSTVVGVYRFIPQSRTGQDTPFYTAEEYDLTQLLAARSHIGNGLVEVSRSCVHHRYRKGPVLPLLWEGIAAYLVANRIVTLFGTVSFWTQSPDDIAEELSWLAQKRAMPSWCTMRARPGKNRVNMLRLAGASLDGTSIRQRIPTLVKGYEFLGGRFGEGAYLDPVCKTIDVAVMVFVEDISTKVRNRFDSTGQLAELLEEAEIQEQLQQYRARAPG